MAVTSAAVSCARADEAIELAAARRRSVRSFIALEIANPRSIDQPKSQKSGKIDILVAGAGGLSAAATVGLPIRGRFAVRIQSRTRSVAARPTRTAIGPGTFPADFASTSRVRRGSVATFAPASAQRRPRSGSAPEKVGIRNLSAIGRRRGIAPLLAAGAKSLVHRVRPLETLRRSLN